MKQPSSILLNAQRFTPGRKATKWLNDEAVARAKIKNEDLNHRMKFMSPGRRLATMLALAS